MVRSLLAATVVVAVFAVFPAGCAPQLLAQTADARGLKTFPFTFPLPQPLHGVIYELKLRVPMPVGTTFRGGWGMVSTNGFKLRSYLDAAGVSFSLASGPPVLFIAIHPRRLAARAREAQDLNLNVMVTVVGPYQSATTVSRGPTDACGELRRFVALMKSGAAVVGYFNLTSRSNADSESIVTSTEKADPHCK
jgi:hypothetical protein